jgi:cyclopropane-fatty-acyl-phospholipid synthase
MTRDLLVSIAELLADVLGDPPFRIESYDGGASGPEGAPATLVVRSPEALSRVIYRPGELGIARAFVAGEIDVDGDLSAVLEFGFTGPELHLRPATLARLAREAGTAALRWMPPPPEEARVRGSLHSKGRDAAAISHHYDISNDFYRLVLGPSMTYSCAVFERDSTTLEEAQAAKHELISEKLALTPDSRLLDIGCGWGSMLIHAAQHHGVRGVGVTLSAEQAELAEKRVTKAALADRIEIRLQDYRDIADGPYDAISSIGMFEHVGRSQLETYLRSVSSLLAPGGRFVNHAIGRPPDIARTGCRARVEATARRVATAVGSSWTSRIDSPLIKRYVFPDGELHEVGTVVSMVQETGLEVRHLETLREHYALTLRQWVSNLEANWDQAVELVGPHRARVWRLYMAACALGFDHGSVQVHQLLAVQAYERGTFRFPLRPTY